MLCSAFQFWLVCLFFHVLLPPAGIDQREQAKKDLSLIILCHSLFIHHCNFLTQACCQEGHALLLVHNIIWSFWKALKENHRNKSATVYLPSPGLALSFQRWEAARLERLRGKNARWSCESNEWLLHSPRGQTPPVRQSGSGVEPKCTPSSDSLPSPSLYSVVIFLSVECCENLHIDLCFLALSCEHEERLNKNADPQGQRRGGLLFPPFLLC